MADENSVSRRRVLRLAAGMGAASVLAACGQPGTPTAPKIGGSDTAKPAAAATQAPAVAKTGGEAPRVYTLVDKVWSDVGMLDATTRFNEENRELAQVTLEETAQGWDTKVLAQIRDKNLRWSAHGYAAFFDQHKYIKAGLVQPLDDYLKASKFAWGAKQKDVYFTSRIYDALLYEGKQYYIPMKANVHMAGWRQDYLEAAGYDTLPKTWDEVDKMLPKMKAALEKEQVIPVALQRELFRMVGTTFTTFIEKPFDDQGVLKFESPEWFQMMEMFKKWMDQGLARFDTTGDSYDTWQKGKFALSLGSHSWVRVGRQVWGSAKVHGGMPPKANESAPDRTWVHIDSGFVFPTAAHPQEATDWLLGILGPEGSPAERWWKGTVTFSGSPVHQPMIDKVLKDNKELAEVNEVMAALPNSQIITIPVAGAYAITEAKMLPWLDRFFKGETGIKDAMAKTRAEVMDELAKQKS